MDLGTKISYRDKRYSKSILASCSAWKSSRISQVFMQGTQYKAESKR